jgi:Co/Zn/Cd efflux system component
VRKKTKCVLKYLLIVYIKGSSRSAFRWSNVFSVVWEFFADVLVVVTGFLIRQRGYFVLDTFVALLLTVLIAHQMIPIMVSSAAVLMQATPSSLPAARLVREISTLPGVLEVRKEHFWTLGGICLDSVSF